VEKPMEMWVCKRYSKEHPKACVEPAKIRVIPMNECEETMKKELSRQSTGFMRKIKELETEVNRLRSVINKKEFKVEAKR